jgi:hypothetical protein
MAVKQLSIYVENKRGSLADITKAIADAGIDLRALSLADTKDYGILRVLCDDPDRAFLLLKEQGMTVSARDVLAFAVPDVPGGMSTIIAELSEGDINIEYAYAATNRDENNAFVIMRVSDNDKAESILREHGVKILVKEDL